MHINKYLGATRHRNLAHKYYQNPLYLGMMEVYGSYFPSFSSPFSHLSLFSEALSHPEWLCLILKLMMQQASAAPGVLQFYRCKYMCIYRWYKVSRVFSVYTHCYSILVPLGFDLFLIHTCLFSSSSCIRALNEHVPTLHAVSGMIHCWAQINPRSSANKTIRNMIFHRQHWC